MGRGAMTGGDGAGVGAGTGGGGGSSQLERPTNASATRKVIPPPRAFFILGFVRIREHSSCHSVALAIVLATALASFANVAAPERAHAGPWTPEPGRGYGKIWLKWLPGFNYFDGDGRSTSYGAYHELFLAAYGEVGLLDEGDLGLAAMVSSDLVRLFFLEDPRTRRTESHVAAPDPTIGLRFRFLRVERFVMAIEESVRAPIATPGPVQDVVSTDAMNPTIGALRVGQGAWDFASSLALGHGWDRVYLAASGGYVVRSEGYDHAVTWTAEGGGSFDIGISVRARVTGYHSIGNGSAPYHTSPSGMGNGTSYIGIAVESDYELTPHFYLGLTLEGGLLAIRRQTGGPVVSVYAATRF